MYIWGGVYGGWGKYFRFYLGWGRGGGGGNTLLQHLQYGSKYIKYYVIILFVEQYKKYNKWQQYQRKLK